MGHQTTSHCHTAGIDQSGHVRGDLPAGRGDAAPQDDGDRRRLGRGDSAGDSGVSPGLHKSRQRPHFLGTGTLLPKVDEKVGVPEDLHFQSSRRAFT